MVTGRGLDPWGAVPLLRNITVVGRALRADARRRGAPTPPCSTTPRSAPRSTGVRPAVAIYDALVLPGRPSRPRDARLPREHRGAADGGRLLPRRQARRGDLPRRPRGGPRRRARQRALRAARPAHHGADLAAGGQGVATRQPDTLLGPGLLPHLRGGAGAAGGVHVRAAGGDARAGRPRRLRGRAAGHPRLPAQDERACTRHRRRTPARPGSCATACTSPPAGRATPTRSPARSPSVLAESSPVKDRAASSSRAGRGRCR